MGRKQELRQAALALTALWLEQHDAGAICEVDCGCDCHTIEAPPCKECCTYVEDEVPVSGDEAKPGSDPPASPEFQRDGAGGTLEQPADGDSPGSAGASNRFE